MRSAPDLGDLDDGLAEAARALVLARQGMAVDEALELADQVESLARRVRAMQLVAARAVAESTVEQRSLSERPAPFGSPRNLLRVRLRISGVEAGRRLEQSLHTLASVSMTGEPLAPRYGRLAELIADGEADATSTSHMLRGLEQARPVAAPEQLEAMEEHLCGHARELDADSVSRLTARWVQGIDHDGRPPSEEELARSTGLFSGRSRHGLHHLKLVVDDAGLEVLSTVFSAGTNPRGGSLLADAAATDAQSAVPRAADSVAHAVEAGQPAPADGQVATDLKAHGDQVAPQAHPVPADRRSVARKRLDALLAACQAAMRARELGSTGGLPTQVLLTMDLDALRHGVGAAFGALTGPIPATQVRRLACDADIIPVVLGTEGQILDVGRARRTAPPWIRAALIARDGGCAFPGCTAPPTWCEAHHIVPWRLNGPTSVENMVLLCPHHHQLVESGSWRVAMRRGVPVFDPPWRTPAHGSMTRNAYHRPPIPLRHRGPLLRVPADDESPRSGVRPAGSGQPTREPTSVPHARPAARPPEPG